MSSSTDSSTLSTPAATLPRRGPSDVFRPRLPLDPFSPTPHPTASVQRAADVDLDAPWIAHDLPALTHAFSQSPHVLLVLGAPSPHALAPLLRSQTFASSLILLVTHTPPPLSALLAAAAPNTAHAAVRVLRLRAALAPTAPAFALTLVSILDAAAAVARSWRASPDHGTFVQLAQNAGGDPAFSVPEPLADGPAHPPLPTNEHLHQPPPRRSLLAPAPTPASALTPNRQSTLSLTSPAKPTFRRRDSASSSKSVRSTSSTRSAGGKTKTTVNDGTRPFDALLSFLPTAQPEKAVLKQVVLVSTLAGGFLAGPAFFNSNSTTATLHLK
ncbi:hypothetical protein B0H19DRAFT_126567 [Mycena capillaripes]|nr:hypothetical protein B0H19DRAFT_126567 [Mycena capillaripes]